jgi:hypothetical protein
LRLFEWLPCGGCIVQYASPNHVSVACHVTWRVLHRVCVVRCVVTLAVDACQAHQHTS